MNQTFTAKEIKYTVKNLKNNKSPGKDDINIELIKHAPDTIHQSIVNIYNHMAEYKRLSK